MMSPPSGIKPESMKSRKAKQERMNEGMATHTIHRPFEAFEYLTPHPGQSQFKKTDRNTDLFRSI